jgi:hypothetical protein
MSCSECEANRKHVKRIDLMGQIILVAFIVLGGFTAWHIEHYAAPLIEEIEELKVEKATLTALVQKEICE